jgi:FkbM family methyltransferase
MMIITLTDMIRKFNLDIRGVLHIGAHHGQEYIEYNANGIENVIFFEPIQNNYKRLLDLVPCGVKTYNIALGNQTGEIDMFVETANGGMSCSVLEPGTHLKTYPNITFNSKEKVKIDKLDNILFDRGNYNMINIDVQGYELEVFKGAVKTLEFIDIIYTEVNTEEVYKGCVTMTELDNYLSGFGFRRVFQSFTCHPSWGDAIYLK